MFILIAAATAFEIAPVVSRWGQHDVAQARHDVAFLITGVGQVPTAYQLSKSIQQKRPDLVIQAGIAGVFGNLLPLTTPVLVGQETFGDLGTEQHGHFETLFDAGFADKDATPYCNGWLINTHPLLQHSSLPVVKGVTVNKVTDSVAQFQQLVAHFNPTVESMEGAALHYVCELEQIPYLQLRTISNRVGDRNKANWNIKGAIEVLNTTLLQLIQQV